MRILGSEAAESTESTPLPRNLSNTYKQIHKTCSRNPSDWHFHVKTQDKRPQSPHRRSRHRNPVWHRDHASNSSGRIMQMDAGTESESHHAKSSISQAITRTPKPSPLSTSTLPEHHSEHTRTCDQDSYACLPAGLSLWVIAGSAATSSVMAATSALPHVCLLLHIHRACVVLPVTLCS